MIRRPRPWCATIRRGAEDLRPNAGPSVQAGFLVPIAVLVAQTLEPDRGAALKMRAGGVELRHRDQQAALVEAVEAFRSTAAAAQHPAIEAMRGSPIAEQPPGIHNRRMQIDAVREKIAPAAPVGQNEVTIHGPPGAAAKRQQQHGVEESNCATHFR